MKHEVVWDAAAYRMLLRIWHAAPDREVVAHAIDQLHDILMSDAAEQGESRENGLRVLLVPPLGVTFSANSRMTEVVILDVWVFRQRGKT